MCWSILAVTSTLPISNGDYISCVTPARGSLRQQTKKESAVDSTCLLISAAVYCNCSSVAPGSAIECNQELELVLAFLPAAARLNTRSGERPKSSHWG